MRFGARGHDIELLLVGREGESVGARNLVGHHRELAGRWIEAIDGGLVLALRLVALVVAQDAEHRIGEPHRAVRLHHDVVGRIERLAIVGIGQHRDGAVVFEAHDAPRVMLAGDQAAAAVAGMAVGVVRGLAEDRDRAALLVPAQHAVVGDVAPQEVAAVAEPDRTLGPATAGVEPLDRSQRQPVLVEGRIEHAHRRIGIALVRLPHRRFLIHCLARMLQARRLSRSSFSSWLPGPLDTTSRRSGRYVWAFNPLILLPNVLLGRVVPLDAK